MAVSIRVTLERRPAPALAAFETAIRRARIIISRRLMAGQYVNMLVMHVAEKV